MSQSERLTRRERQVMDVLFAMEQGTVNDVRESLPDFPSYSATRAVLNRLVDKRELNITEQGPRYVYSPAVSVSAARKTALQKVMNTFFGGSSLEAMAALLGEASDELDAEEIERLETLIAKAQRKKGGNTRE